MCKSMAPGSLVFSRTLWQVQDSEALRAISLKCAMTDANRIGLWARVEIEPDCNLDLTAAPDHLFASVRLCFEKIDMSLRVHEDHCDVHVCCS